jgi:hypothetical protein
VGWALVPGRDGAGENLPPATRTDDEKRMGERMSVRTCLNCVYVCCDPYEWVLCHERGESLVPKCANHPQWPGQLHDVPGTPCRNYEPKPPEPKGDIRRIPLGEGQFAIVDAADYEWLKQHQWHFWNGYAARQEKRKTIYMHREIMQPPKGMVVDHINHNKGDDRRVNLRVCTQRENILNHTKKGQSISRFKGVEYNRLRRKWYVRIRFHGERIRIGYFDDEVEAARAYDRKAVELSGVFACLNFPDEWPPEKRQQVYADAQPLRDALKAKAARAKAREKGKKAKGKSAAARAQTPARQGRRRTPRDTRGTKKKSRPKTHRAPRTRKS